MNKEQKLLYGTAFAPISPLNNMFMTFEQFQALPKDIQRNVVKHCGTFLFGRTGVGVNVMLYQVEGFYVEIYFDEKMSEAIRIKSFEDTRYLEPYLRRIDVSELQLLL